MLNRFSIFAKFLISSVIIFTILTISSILISNFLIKESFINRSKIAVGHVAQLEAKDLTMIDFSLKNPTRTLNVFTDFYNKIKTSEIIRIKVWDYSGKVIFSDDKAIVGLRFPDNEEFKKALNGNIVSEIGQKTKPENVSEQGYEQLLEVYVPIIFKNEQVPSGVIEVYFKLDGVNSRIKETQTILIIALIIFTFTSFGLLLIVFKRIVFKQIEKINLQAVALDNASDHIIITDKDGKILYVNRAAEKLTGYSKSEMIGFRPSLWGKQMPNEFYENMWQTIKDEKKAFKGEIINKRKDGTEYKARIEISPILNKNKKAIFFVGIERDITREKAVDKAKTEFISLVSHQLRTPLTSINWYIEMLQNGDAGILNDKQKEFLNEIYLGSKRMVQLVNDLLNISHLETGIMKISPVKTNLKTFIQEMRKEIDPLVQERNCEISLDLPKQETKDLDIDRTLLRQVIINFLTNSFQYSQSDKKLAIVISLVVNPENYSICIKDNGIGVPENEQGLIFEKFFRSANAKTLEANASGLGLYFAKQIMDTCGGSIGFSSEIGHGSTFYVTIPLSGMKSNDGKKDFKL